MATETVTIDTSAENSGPSLEEEAKAQEAAQGEQQVDDTLPSEKQEADPDRPEWLPEKFKSPEDLAKAYSELESKLGKANTTEEAQGEAEEAMSNAGLDYEAFAQEYSENGSLSDEAYKALENAGIPQHIVDSYIAGLEAQSTMMRGEVLEAVGGEEAYTEMVDWAADNLDEGQIDAFNATLESGDVNQIKMAITALQAQYSQSTGNEPSRTVTGRAAGEGPVYESVAELTRDMGDPRYMEDPAFRSKVEAKLARSNIL